MEEYLNTSAAKCRKNPRHMKFTATSVFKPSHLPDSVRSLLVWALLCHKARLTVKLRVDHVSPNRPAALREEYSNRNSGSGYVTDLDICNPDNVVFTVETAAHVVFDETEANNTIAAFYFHMNNEVFRIQNARLLAVNSRKDISRLIFTIDIKTLQCLATDRDLSALQYALSPSVLPNVNDKMNISLLQSVVVRCKTTEYTRLSFLFTEIKCLRHITFISNITRLLEIEMNFSPKLLYDIILLIMALASRCDNVRNFVNLMNFLEGIVYRDDIHTETAQRPFITLCKEIRNNDNVAKSKSKLPLHEFIDTDNEPLCVINSNFNIRQNETLLKLMTSLTTTVDRAQLNEALRDFCGFDISARFKKPGVIVFEIVVETVNVPDRMSLDVHLHDVIIEEEHKHCAVLISQPHDMPQQITTGHLEHSLTSREISYTTPSCPGSSGGPVWVIPREPKSLEEIENIDVITHSCATSQRGFGN